VGYIQELFGRTFGQPVKVELLESVLHGGKRCKFKIELAG
jgi:predicted hydrocarbon binding protein